MSDCGGFIGSPTSSGEALEVIMISTCVILRAEILRGKQRTGVHFNVLASRTCLNFILLFLKLDQRSYHKTSRSIFWK